MRLLTAVLLLLPTLAVHAQDASTMAMQAAQQAQQQAEQANQQAAAAAQQANQTAMQNAQAAASEPVCCGAAKPRFSMKPGTYPSSITVRMKDRNRGTYIYYPPDGGPPPPLPRRYTGPITLSSTTTLQ